MIDDKDLKKSVETKFYLGQNRKAEEHGNVLTKQAITSLSTGLTSIQNAFNQVKAYTNNTAKIQKAVIAARVAGKQEALIEKPNIAPIQPSGDQITSLFPELSKGLEELQQSLEKLDLGQAGQQSQTASGGGSSIIGKLAAGAAIGAAGYGMYSMLAPDEAQAATPPPEPKIEPPKSSEIAKEVETRAADRKSDSKVSGAVQAQKAASQEQDTERLAKVAEKAATQSAGVTRTAAPTATSDQTSSFSDFIGKTVGAVNKRVASFQPGGGSFAAGASGDELGGGSDLTSGSYDLKLAKLLQNYEGAKTQAYKDSRGIPTIGIGATYYPPGFRLQGKVQMGQTITEEEAQQIKAAHVEEHRGRLLKEVSSGEYSAMPEGVKAALESKVFNYGSLGGTLTQLSKQAVKTKNYKPVSNFFRTTLASHNNGLNSWRRNDEAELIDTGRSPRAKISFGGSGGSPSAQAQATGPIQRSGGAVQGMGFETAAAATRQAGIRGTNGNLDSGQLASIGVGSFVAQPQAAQAFKAMRAAAAKEGINIGVVSAYRSYQRQVELKKQKGRMAATPGRSNHGWGLAFDIPGLAEGNKTYKWMQANAERFGIFGPLASPKEIWHWEYRGGGSLRPATVPITSAAQQQQDMSPRLRTPAGMTMNNAAVMTPKEDCNCDGPQVIPIPVGGGGASPTDYLKGMKPAQTTRKYNVNTSEDYKVYFNAA